MLRDGKSGDGVRREGKRDDVGREKKEEGGRGAGRRGKKGRGGRGRKEKEKRKIVL